MDDFRKLQTKRDSAAAMLLVGIPLLLLSAGYLAFVSSAGFNFRHWFDYNIGPVSLVIGLPLTIIGSTKYHEAKRLQEHLDDD